MPRRSRKPPSYRRKRVNDSIYAVTTLADAETGERRDVYLGEWASDASREAYARTLAEWEASGRRLPNGRPEAPACITVGQLCATYLDHVDAESAVRSSIRTWLKLHASTPADRFGPNALRQVRLTMATGENAVTRRTANKYARFIVAIIRWGVAHELVDERTWNKLKALEPLKAGTPGTRETEPVKPVPIEHVDAALEHLGRVVSAMVRLQLLTGMRSGEVMRMKPADVERRGRTWCYIIERHKTAHLGHVRLVHLGPRAQEIITPFLDRPDDAFMFSPAEALADRLAARSAARTTPLKYGNRPGTNRQASPKRKPKDRYTSDSYRRAITRACERAKIPAWHPHQLRHTAATEIRRSHGLEAAAIILGHSSAAITDAVYAERDMSKAAEVALAIG